MADAPRTEGAPTPLMQPYEQLLAYLLRTSQQNLVQMSAMADMKASILITTTAILLTVAAARFDDGDTRAAFAVLSAFSLLSLIIAVLAVLPKAGRPPAEHRRFNEQANILFFGHFASMTEDEYVEAMRQVIATDNSMVSAQLRDIHQSGVYLQQQKFRYLRFAYLSLLAGFLLSGATQAVVIVGNLAG